MCTCTGAGDDESVETNLPDLTRVTFNQMVAGPLAEALDATMRKLLARVDQPAASLSGYSGAGGDEKCPAPR